MSARVLKIETVVQDPAIRGGRPVVSGTGLRVSDIAAWHVSQGLSVEEIAEQFSIDLADAHAALSYYYAHRSEIDSEIREDAEEAERLRRELRA